MDMCWARRGQIVCGRPVHSDEVHRAEVAVNENDPDAGTRIETWRDDRRVSTPSRRARRP